MKLPNGYTSVRQSLPVSEVSYGVGGIELLSNGELEEGQIGYSIGSDGASLSGDGEGDWRNSWIVVGRETACGDPLFIDTTDPLLPVFTAIHGEGSWSPKQVAISFDAFASSMREFAKVALGRANPVELDNNPLPESVRETFLQRITELNGHGINLEFWELMIES